MPVIARPESLTATVLRHLRNSIVDGDIALGQPLYERTLAEELGVSKTPVREALAQLRMEGLVTIVPQKGAFVFSLSASEVAQICELRETLENAALDYALSRNPEILLAAIAAAVASMDAAKAAGDERAYLAADTAFHQAFFDHCGNDYLRDAYRMFSAKIAALRTHLATKPLHTRKSFTEHHEILAAIETRDLERALAILQVHIGRTKSTYTDEIKDIAEADRNASTATG